jgi:hypothetical protein
VKEPTVDVLPLVKDRRADHTPGWCTYTHEVAEAPELEVLCGGINGKTPRAAAVWRQGHLLHFGFEPSPDRMSDAGKALLVNCVCYIARFTEDRPVVRTPCAFTDGRRLFDRGVVERWLASPDADRQALRFYLGKVAYREVGGKSREDVGAGFQEVRGYLHADGEGRLEVDAEAQAFGVPPSGADFLDKAVAAMGEPARVGLARQLLGRYASEGPGAEAPAEEWRAWTVKNRPYLFFSDAGGYRWYVDPLARRRGVPTAELRGQARADRSP